MMAIRPELSASLGDFAHGAFAISTCEMTCEQIKLWHWSRVALPASAGGSNISDAMDSRRWWNSRRGSARTAAPRRTTGRSNQPDRAHSLRRGCPVLWIPWPPSFRGSHDGWLGKLSGLGTHGVACAGAHSLLRRARDPAGAHRGQLSRLSAASPCVIQRDSDVNFRDIHCLACSVRHSHWVARWQGCEHESYWTDCDRCSLFFERGGALLGIEMGWKLGDVQQSSTRHLGSPCCEAPPAVRCAEIREPYSAH